MPRTNKQAYNQYMREYMARRYEERKQRSIEQLGGECTVCGSTENLEFDHIDPESKDLNATMCMTQSEKKWQTELAKCQLLCHTCHQEKHYGKKGLKH